MTIDREKFMRQANALHEMKVKQFELQKEYFETHCEPLDADGYPTNDALRLIEIWPWDQKKEWFDFIHSIWHLAGWGWSVEEVDHEYYKDKKVMRYDISTAGWSGNESIVRSMQKNDMLWFTTWVSSRRGGHYVWEIDGDIE